MADVDINKFRASVVREGSKPASPGFIVSEGQSPTDPAGSGQNHLPVTIATAATGLSITESQVLGGAGNVGQYIRGDGSLADFPESSGGGSSVSYYLNGSVAQGTIGGIAYKELNKVPVLGAGTDFTIAADGYIASFITDANDPNLIEIPGGNWNFETYFSASSGGGSPSFYVELYKVNSGGTATLIASNSGFPELIAFGTNIISYFSTLAVPTTTLALTDRLAIRYYVTHSGRTITLHTEDNHLCQIITTFTTGLTSLNGLTAQVQNLAVGTSGTDFNIASATATHTFNLPTASATNRGALSSADWTTFNNKQNALTLTTSGSSGASTLVGATLNVPTYTLSGLGGVPTSRQLTINGTAFDLSADRSWSVGTVTSVGLSSATSGVTIGSSPVTTSGTITLAIATASGSQNGLLSSTDWTTFNNKQNALTNPVTGTGTTNYLPKFTGSTTIGNSNLINDASGNLGLGVTPSAWSLGTALDVANGPAILGFVNETYLINNAYFNSGFKYKQTSFASMYVQNSTGEHRFFTAPSGTAGNAISFTQAMTLFSTGNLLVGSPSPISDNGARLQVSGAATFSDTITSTKTSEVVFTNTSGGTNRLYTLLQNTSGYFLTGVEGASAGSLVTNSTAYAGVITTNSTSDLVLGTNFTRRLLIDKSTGAATFSESVNVGTHDGLDFLNIERYASSVPYAIIRAGSTDQNVGVGLMIQARDSAGNAFDHTLFASSGNVGIGTDSPIYVLDAYSTGSSTARLRVQGTTNFALTQAQNSSGILYMGIDSSTANGFGLGNYSRIIWSSAAYPLIFAVNDAERIRITSVGDVYFGNSTISVANTALFFTKSNGNIIQVFSHSSGTVTIQEYYKQGSGITGSITYNGTNTLYNATSDYRLKEDLKDYNALQILGKLKTYDFKWKNTNTRDFGMLAHELQEILPNYVSGQKDELTDDKSVKPQLVDYSKIVPLLIKSIQELKQEIDTLKN